MDRLKIRLFELLIIAAFAFSCKSSSPIILETAPQDVISREEELVEEELPEEIVEPTRHYQATPEKKFKLVHTKLEISLNWEEELLNGIATIELRPWFYPQSKLELDAKNIDVDHVHLLEADSAIELDFCNNGNKLAIDLDKIYTKDDQFLINIKYAASQKDYNNNSGKSIQSDKGIYFINPSGTEKKPTQVWTQGETESNSRWFPTIDAPNQRCTQEMFITVKNQLTTLSNGTLIYSKQNSDSTRTDYWKMDQPHAPYLFMFVVGTFKVVKDQWKNVPLEYYVEPEFHDDARAIFGRTPEMMGYFSEILDYPFPWQKYAQIPVRDYVSGAMENTTASVFMEEVQVTKRELIDYNWDDIIAHELFHQWFGDLVTCESWANVTLNEAFATYSEYLWKHHKEGAAEAEYHLYEELRSYLQESQLKKEDLVRFYYDDADDLFDNHSYAKGALILHLLRSYVGDDAFFASMKAYLKKHEYAAAEVHDLRLVFEEVTGKDLNWFFNQWFLDAGHPELQVEDIYDDSLNIYTINILQEQDTELYPVYRLPMTIDYWIDGKKTSRDITVNQKHFQLQIETLKKPELLVIDSKFELVGEIEYNQSKDAYFHLYNNYNHVVPKIIALDYFSEDPYDSISRIALEDALDDPFRVISQSAMAAFYKDSTLSENEKLLNKIVYLANQSDPVLRADAISLLGSANPDTYMSVFESALDDSSYTVVGSALDQYLSHGKENIDSVIGRFENENNIQIVMALADYFLQSNDTTRFSWFENKIESVQSEDLWYLTRMYGIYLMYIPTDTAREGVQHLRKLALGHSKYYVRVAAYQSLEYLSDWEGVEAIIAEIEASEKDPRVIEYFRND